MSTVPSLHPMHMFLCENTILADGFHANRFPVEPSFCYVLKFLLTFFSVGSQTGV